MDNLEDIEVRWNTLDPQTKQEFSILVEDIDCLIRRLNAAETVCEAYLIHHGKDGGVMLTYRRLRDAITAWKMMR